jgi:hypothetical protein
VTAERLTALVVEAEPPIDNRIKLGKRAKGTVRILAGEGEDRIYTAGSFMLDRKHWLVPGMMIPVMVDRSHPEGFEVVWEEIPDMEQLAAANEPFLADPLGTRRKLGELVISATSPIGATARASTEPDSLEQQLAQAEQEAAQPGKQRAVVLIATSLTTLYQDSEEAGMARSHKTSEGKHDTVLAVNVAGQEPYAVFKKDFKHPRKEKWALGAGIPALVSLTDPGDVEVLWKEAQAAGEAKLGAKIAAASDAMKQAQSGTGQLEQAMLQAQQDAIKRGPPGPSPGGQSQVNPQMRAMMIPNAKLALSSAPPNMRPMLIQQYRMAGIEIDEQGNVVE